MRILAAMDKFKGTLSALDAAAAVCRGAAGHDCDLCPIADGGDGTLEAFGGPNRTAIVSGPHGGELTAGWRLGDGLAIIEMATASGLVVGADHQDPVTATTFGTGQLIAAALEAGAERILIGVGGSATTDGGQGAIEAIRRSLGDGRLPVPVTVLCDVSTAFTRAAEVFGPQKGASPGQVKELTARLHAMRQRWLTDFDVDTVPGSGAGGGLAGGLASLGAVLEPGFEVIADHLGLAARIDQADLIVTGEGRFDETSYQGKAVGGVVALARGAAKPVVIIAGSTAVGGPNVMSLADRFGDEAWTNPGACLETAVREALVSLGDPRG